MGTAIFIRHFEHSHYDWLNHTKWYLVSVSTRLCAIGLTIPHGSTQIQHCPEVWNLSQYCFIFEHNTHANMLYRLLNNCKYMDIYFPIHQEYCYLGKQKISLYFLYQLLNVCDLHLFRLLEFAICRTIPVKLPPIGQLSPILKVY